MLNGQSYRIYGQLWDKKGVGCSYCEERSCDEAAVRRSNLLNPLECPATCRDASPTQFNGFRGRGSFVQRRSMLNRLLRRIAYTVQLIPWAGLICSTS